jgi:Trypsin-like peptidase domain
MTVSLTRWSLTGALWAALILAPALCNAQAPGETGPKGSSNLTRQTQNEIDIALPSLARLVERVMPAVVNISVDLKEQVAAEGEGNTGDESASPLRPNGTPFDQFLKRFFEQPFQSRNPAEKVMALGSGFIIDPAGYIVTNNHVVANADKVTAIFQDNSQHTAKVIGRDEKTDIGLLKIDSNRKLPYVTWGNSDDAKVGDWVVAVGNPFRLGRSVTAGIISPLGRDITEGPYAGFLQFDAPINPRPTTFASSRPSDRHQYRDLLAFGRAVGSAAPFSRTSQALNRPAQGARIPDVGLARGGPSERHAGDRQEPWPRSRPPDGWPSSFGHLEEPGRSGRHQTRRRDHRHGRPRHKSRARAAAPCRIDGDRHQARFNAPNAFNYVKYRMPSSEPNATHCAAPCFASTLR